MLEPAADVLRAGGALLGGAIFAWTGGYRFAYAAAALCLLASAALLARVEVAPAAAPEPPSEGRPR
jgi:hypothetical protein